jgi:3,4-dihydroxy 2-butanone 4-phosphate synthase/GTP cyclohydrolase II
MRTPESTPVADNDALVREAIDAIAAGRAVVVVDAEDRENEGDLVFAAQRATLELLAFQIRYSSGVICAPMPGTALDRLRIPLMTQHNNEAMRTAFTVTVDAGSGVGTGISAADRARTLRVLADPASTSSSVVQPGHIFPLRAREGGVLVRPGHTEAAADLVRLAGAGEVGVIAELVNDDGTMKRGAELVAFGAVHGLPVITIADLAAYRRRHESQVQRGAAASLPTAAGEFVVQGYRDTLTGTEYLALVAGNVTDGLPTLARIHSECLTGDVFGSLRCDCGSQLRTAMNAIAAAGRGIVVYNRGHEGRGIGLLSKVEAYALQDSGADTVEANVALGLPVDARDYAVAAQILRDLDVTSVRLMTNNPAKVDALLRYGIKHVERVPIVASATEHNVRYLETKRDRMGHQLGDVVPGFGVAR